MEGGVFMVFLANWIQACKPTLISSRKQRQDNDGVARQGMNANRSNRLPFRCLKVLAATMLLFQVSAFFAAKSYAQQSTGPRPGFDLTVIKPSKPGAQGSNFRVRGKRFEIRNMSLSDLICLAYGLHPSQVIGIPAWGETSRFDLTAQSDAEGPANEMLWKRMLQSYLGEQFRLSFHRDTQELSLYVLAVSGTGARLTASKGDPNGIPGLVVTLGALNAEYTNQGALTAANASMEDLADAMRRLVLEYPVVDETGIEGRFDLALKWTPSTSQFRALRANAPALTDGANPYPDLFTAIREQMGLELKVMRGPIEVLAIDHVEKPFDF
jgi:uncharacterized protein (TIGR03435 family)